MTRLSRLGCETPVYFPSIIAKHGLGDGSSDETAGTNGSKFTPTPPQKGKHSKKPPANDYRIHLEPLKPLSGLGPSASTESLPSGSHEPRRSFSSPASTASLSSQLAPEGLSEGQAVTARATPSDAEACSGEISVKQQLQFYRQLANVRFREVVRSEEMLLKTIDALLQSTAEALRADWAVLYAIDHTTRMLNVTACTKPGVAGFEVSLDKFAMEMVVTSEEPLGTPRQNASMYVADMQTLSTYDWHSDVDSQAQVRTCSTLASVIVDEQGKPIFVVEARSLRCVAFPTSLFAAAMTTLENIVYQYDLKQTFTKTSDTYNQLDEFLQKTVLPLSVMTEHQLTTTPSSSSLMSAATAMEDDHEFGSMENPAEESGEEDEEVAAANREEQRWLVSPNLTQLVSKLMIQSQSDAICLLDFHPIKKKCRVLAQGRLVRPEGGRNHVGELPADLLAGFKGMGDVVSEDSSQVTLFRKLVESVERADPVDLTAHHEVPSLLGTLEPKTVVFLPLPRTMAASYAGLLCISKQEQHCFDVGSLKPFLASLALAVVLKKKNEDMNTSTSQKKKLINLFNSHFQVENINDPSALVNMICDIGQSIFNTKRVTLYVADPIKSELWSLSTLGSVNGIRIPYGKGIAGTVAYTKQVLIVRNAYDDPRFDRSFDVKFGFKTESLFTFPILDKNGETLGVIQAVNSMHFMDAGAHPLIKKFDEKVLDVYNHLVSHALRINSSLIMFAKVQADYWANRVVMDIHDEDESNAKHDVASVHSLLDISGFDESKRVPRNKWSTFAYACWALGKFLAKCFYKRRREQSMKLRAAVGLEPIPLEDQDERSTTPASQSGTEEFKEGSDPPAFELRRKSRNSIVRATRASSLVNRWRRMTMKFSPANDEMLSDDFDPLSKSMDELKHYSFLLFEGLLLITTFRIEIQTLRNFVGSIMARYRNIPYHNFYHGFDVAHSSYRLIRQTSVLDIIKEYEALSILVAALGHDADHPGNDNQFEIESSSTLALCYNDISVLENHHAATTFDVLRSPGCDILEDLSLSMRSSVRTAIIRCILATDMKHHSKLLGELASVSRVADFENVTDGRQLMLNMIIHGSDLGNVARPLPIARKWVDLVCEEFTLQAKKYEQVGVAVPPHIVNLHEESVKFRLQVNFIDYLVAPLWNSIAGILPEAKKYVDNLRANREFFFENAGQMSARRASSMPQH